MNIRSPRSVLLLPLLAPLLASVSAAQWLGPPPTLDPDRIQLRESTIGADTVDTFTPFDTFNRIAVRNAYKQFYAPAMPAMAWTGSIAGCNAGTISAAFKDWTISRVNFARAMAGLPGNITLDPITSAKAQQAALMFSANQSLSHFPDPNTWLCYTTDGADAASHSNIANSLGSSAFDDVVPRYLDDSGGGNEPVGHRRWILYPPQVTMGVGSTPTGPNQWGGNALWVLSAFGARPATPNGTPWPPRGYVPLALFPSSQRWSLSFPGAVFANATVTMTANGASVPVTYVSTSDNGYGDNTIVWQASTTPTDGIDYAVAITGVSGPGVPTSFSYHVLPFDPADPVRMPSDFNGDGKSDIIWDNGAGSRWAYFMNGTAIQSGGPLPAAAPGWVLVGTGDFNGDGREDLLWQNTAVPTQFWIYLMNGSAIIGGGGVTAAAGYSPRFFTDFDGDGKADILFENASGARSIFLMNGTAVQSAVTVPAAAPGWALVGVGDFNGDGKADLLWQNTASPTQFWIYLLNGAALIGGGGLSAAPGYVPARTGDFNGDGKADILWENGAGARWMYFMNGASLQGSAAAPAAAPGWNIVGSGDFNGDGFADLLWQNSAAPTQYWIYLLDGASVIGQAGFSAAPGYTPRLPSY